MAFSRTGPLWVRRIAAAWRLPLYLVMVLIRQGMWHHGRTIVVGIARQGFSVERVFRSAGLAIAVVVAGIAVQLLWSRRAMYVITA